MGIKTTLTGLAGVVAVAASTLFGSGDAEAQQDGNTAFNEDRGIISCEVDGDGIGRMTRETGVERFSRAWTHTEDAIFSSDGSAGATKICDRTDDVAQDFGQSVDYILPADNHICVQLEDGSFQAYLPDGEEYDETARILSTEFSQSSDVEGLIGSCILETEQGLREAPIFTAKAAGLDM